MKSEIVQAIIDLKQAEQNFQYASKEFIEIAIHQLYAAEHKVTALIELKVGNKKKADPLRENPLKNDWFQKLSIGIIPQENHTVKKEIQIKKVNLGINSKRYLSIIGKNF